MALIHYTPELHSALQQVAEQQVMRTDLWSGDYRWRNGMAVVPESVSLALEELRHAHLIVWDFQPEATHAHSVYVLLTFDGSDRLSAWNREHQDGAA